MTEITCLNNYETKKYIIPTDTWLEPLNIALNTGLRKIHYDIID